MALSVEVLRALAVPASAAELARRLDASHAHVQRELEHLERRGYARRLACGESACGWCAFRSTCDTASAPRWLRR